jgi:predicted 2-oxoglutarate/Fe(II)-dependent dioxygenase YbiX
MRPSNDKVNAAARAVRTPENFDLFFIREFFDAATREKILVSMRSANRAPATVYKDAGSGVIDERVRRLTRVLPDPDTIDLVRQELLDRKEQIGEHFDIVLRDCEEPQFLHYRVGDFFVMHQDGNTGLIRSTQNQFRKVSVSIFLNSESDSSEPGTYAGGSLVFHRWGIESFRLRADAGTLVAFRSETTHEVIPVTEGERYAIACWLG